MLRLLSSTPTPLESAPPGFSCVRARTRGADHVTLTGELDLVCLPRVEDALRVAGADGGLVVVDLRRLTFIDGAGLRVLVQTDRRISRLGGRMIVVNGAEMVRWFLGLVRAEDELELVDDLPAAAGGDLADHGTVVAPVRHHRSPGEKRVRLGLTVRLLTVTAERDELLTRVGALEQELMDLVCLAPDVPGADQRQEA